ncbi:MAG TPA: hypothetical protein VK451_07130 [Methyloceanibacter sp.]|jgi:hypothetical protein|nr:hypothetical protein [Methyloceanibacter sp.]
MLIRYALLVALAASSVWCLIVVSKSSGSEMLLADAGQSGTPVNVSFWLLASVATLITLSLFRFLVFGLPALVDACFKDTRTWSYLLVLGGLIYGVFYLAS